MSSIDLISTFITTSPAISRVFLKKMNVTWWQVIASSVIQNQVLLGHLFQIKCLIVDHIYAEMTTSSPNSSQQHN